ncbi:hypothetical protein OE88DRAFT_1640216 [Heliocybe sulcata]|uniref:JmjC domain-containing protein n=1 Tax=Heliocybe sulcata TaxID=5364 RepID=A0A5C3MKK7_9AGAM|nr:hypothetical protein OE88DRAFT_1640216 [Heliocybe sulcata]
MPITIRQLSGVGDVSATFRPDVSRFHTRDLDNKKFLSLWSEGRPFIVEDILGDMQGSWGPDYFADTYGSDIVSVVDCETNTSTSTTVRDFFRRFETCRNGKPLKLKVNDDWPPDTEFSAKFPQLFKAFVDALPVPDYTRPDGVANLTAHFPPNGVIPDLGPKMYNAYGTGTYSQHGTTRLHLDVTSAVNLMLYAVAEEDGSPGSAVWHIFPRSTCSSIRKLISESDMGEEMGDPIHNQKTYVSREMLDRLRVKYDVVPWEIKQRPGEAVFIPAGCAHQVCNISNSIKVALDFLSVADLPPTERVGQELRIQRIITDWGEDVLCFYDVLWYAWLSLSQQMKFRGNAVIDYACDPTGMSQPVGYIPRLTAVQR